MAMTFKEKTLYHQIHPVKLFVDIASGLFTTYLMWQHNVIWFLILFLLPSAIISFILIKFVPLESLKESRFGKYIEKNMTSTITAFRLAGQIIMWVAGWYHLAFFIFIGLLVIVLSWLSGLIDKSDIQ